MDRIYCSGPSITQKEIDYVTDAVTTCWYGDANKYHVRFERAAAEYVGRKHAISVPTGTSAIHLSLLSMGIGAGDEVIVPEITWIGCSAPVHYVGAQPIFADIDPETFCISPAALQDCLTPRTRAVIVVDLYGTIPNFDEIKRICDRHNVQIIEDAAQAFGSELNGKRAGSFGTTSIFSLHGSKTVTSGEGGLMVTDSDALQQHALTLRDHGRRISGDRFLGEFDRYYWHFEIGNKFKMSSMQAALGLAQIERAAEILEHKHRIFDCYAAELADLETVELKRPRPGLVSSHWLPLVTLDSSLGIDKYHIMSRLEQENIDIRPAYYPLSSQPVYRDTAVGQQARARNLNAYRVSPLGFNLPSCPGMESKDVRRVVDALRQSIAAETGCGAA